jgi:hypothetical protein
MLPTVRSKSPSKKTHTFKLLEEVFQKRSKEAIALILQGESSSAIAHIKAFNTYEPNRLRYILSQKRAQKLSKLKEALKKQEFHRAYEMGESEAYLRTTPKYQQFELYVLKVYHEAIEALKSRANKIELTKIFGGLLKIRIYYQLMQGLVKNPAPYLRLEKMYIQGDFQGIEKLVLVVNELKNTPTYLLLQHQKAEIEEQFYFAKMEGDYDEALLLMNQIKKEMPYLVASLQSEFDELIATIPFMRAYDKCDYMVAYNLSAKHNFLCDLPAYSVIQKEISKYYKEASQYAFNGECEKMKSSLPMKNCKHPECVERLAFYDRVCYARELFKVLKPSNNHQWMDLIHDYMNAFGRTSELENFLKEHHKQALLSGHV